MTQRYSDHIQVIGDRIEFRGVRVGTVTIPVSTLRAEFEEEMKGSYSAGVSRGYDNAVADIEEKSRKRQTDRDPEENTVLGVPST